MKKLSVQTVLSNLFGFGKNRGKDVLHVAQSRQAKYGSNTLIAIVAFAGILVLANLLVKDQGWRWDLTKNKAYSLSDETMRVVKAIKKPITVYAFYPPDYSQEGLDLLKEYTNRNKIIKLQVVDPYKRPDLATQYGLTRAGTVIFTQGNLKEEVTSATESDFTSALVKMQNPVKVNVAFLTGDGEKDTDDTGDLGYSTLRDTLGKLNYTVSKVDLHLTNQIASDAAALVIASPQNAFNAKQLDAVRAYLASGGRVLVLLDASRDNRKIGLEDLLTQYGVNVTQGVVIDPQQYFVGPANPAVTQYPTHKITENLLRTLYPGVLSVAPAEKLPENAAVETIVQSSSQSWLETSPIGLAETPRKDATDIAGPVSLAVAMNYTAPKGQEKDSKYKARLVVLGDSDLASNVIVTPDPSKELYEPGNLDLVVNSINLFTARDNLFSIIPKDHTQPTFSLTNVQQRTYFYLVLVVLPALALLSGALVWWKRRKNRIRK